MLFVGIPPIRHIEREVRRIVRRTQRRLSPARFRLPEIVIDPSVPASRTGSEAQERRDPALIYRRTLLKTGFAP